MTYESSVMAVKMFEFSSKEELFSFNANIDCPYCTKPVTASQHHLSTHHLRCAIHYSENGIGKFSIPCFCPEERRGKRSHWHCTKCTKIIQRSSDFRLHLSNHGMVMTDKPQDGEETSMDNTYVGDTPEERPPCQKCDSLFATPPSFRQQSKQQNGKHEQPMLCVDAKNGIYVTPKDSEGTSIPIHICKSLVAQSFLCELDSCREFMSMAAQSGNPGKECFHLERTKNARCYSPPPPLCNASLEEMAEKGILSKSRKDECMALVSRAFMEEVDCVFPVFWEENGPERFVYFSVFADQNEVWCTFGRTCVTLDTKFGKWHCQCPDANNAQYSCIHQHLCMWWVFQERPCWRQSATVNRMGEMDGIPAKIMKTDDIL